MLLLRGRTKLCCLGSVRGAGHYYYSIPSMLRALSVFRACCRFNLSACAPHEWRDMRRRRCGDEDVSRSVMASAASHPSPLASQQPNNSPCCWAYGQDAELLGNTVYVAPSRLARGVVGAWKGHGCSVACARGGTNPRTVKNILSYGDAMAHTVRLRLLCIYTRDYSMYTYCLDISAQSVDSHARPPFDAASMLAEGSIEWKMEGPGAAESRRLFLSRGGGPVPSKIPKLSRLWNSRRAEWPARD